MNSNTDPKIPFKPCQDTVCKLSKRNHSFLCHKFFLSIEKESAHAAREGSGRGSHLTRRARGAEARRTRRPPPPQRRARDSKFSLVKLLSNSNPLLEERN
jgi:hypothetical protein